MPRDLPRNFGLAQIGRARRFFDDRFREALKEFRVELSGPLVDIKMDATLRDALVIGAVEQAIQEWGSSGKITTWINWHALMSTDEKMEVLD
jgi:hypothetical protein